MPIPLVSVLEFTIIFRMAMVPVRQRSLLRGEVNLPKAAQRRARNFEIDLCKELTSSGKGFALAKMSIVIIEKIEITIVSILFFLFSNAHTKMIRIADE